MGSNRKEILCFVLFVLQKSIVRSDFITNAPIFLSNVSPILYHEACFSSSVCLDRSKDDVLYVTCDGCRHESGVRLNINRCKASNQEVRFNQNCSLLGGFCANIDENYSVCVPAVPYNDTWWPEAVPSNDQNCRAKCGVDRAFFTNWNESGGYEKTCLCPLATKNDDYLNSTLDVPTLLENIETYRLLNREPFPFCYFEQCSYLINYKSRFLRQNFTGIALKKTPHILVIAFKTKQSGEMNASCLGKINSLPIVLHGMNDEPVDTSNNIHCTDQDSLLYLYPEHLPIYYYERKDQSRN